MMCQYVRKFKCAYPDCERQYAVFERDGWVCIYTYECHFHKPCIFERAISPDVKIIILDHKYSSRPVYEAIRHVQGLQRDPVQPIFSTFTESLLARVHPSGQFNATSDVLSAWRAIDYGVTVVTAKNREKYWIAWRKYANMWKIDPFFQAVNEHEATIVVSAFAARVWTGHYGHGLQVRVPTVATEMSAITASIKLAGKRCPFKETKDNYVLPIKRLVEGLKGEDPPAIPQLAVLIAVPEECCKRGLASSSFCEQATVDPTIIAFYYLL